MTTENIHETETKYPSDKCFPRPAVSDRSRWRYLKDMELPPDMRQVVEDYCRKYKLRKVAERAQVEDDIKLQHFFGGRNIAYMRTPEGLVVTAVGELGTEDLRSQLSLLNREDRYRVILYCPSIWNEEISQI